MPSFAQRWSLALVVVALGPGCRTSSQISSAEGDTGNRNNSSTGLGNLGGGNDKPDASHVDPPNDLKPFADAGTADTAIKEEKCAGESQMAKQVPIDLLLLVDRSGSMNNKVSPMGKTKWELAQDALTAFVKDSKSAGMGVGLQYFPLILPCNADADCGLGSIGFGACTEQRVCAGMLGPANPPQTCSTRGPVCPAGTACTPLGRCSQTADVCTNINDVCPGGLTTNRCTALPKSCRDSFATNCSVSDFQKLAVPIGDLPTAAGALTFSLLSTQAGGATPTDPAVQAAIAELRIRATANPGRHEALVLVTDGSPNGCDADPIPLVTTMLGDAKMGTPSIPTYAIGVFGEGEFTGGEATLTQWSTAGGTGMPFILSATDDLTQKLLAALDAIRGSALPCEYTIPTPASGMLDFKKVNVHVTGSSTGAMGVDVGHVDDPSKCDAVKGGWYYDVDPAAGTPTRVVMCDATCKKFKMDATANIELRFGCQTVVIQ
jgi:Mg-chelatase subunit ChlD